MAFITISELIVLAEYLNISPYTYSHYETQDTIIPLKHLIKFCDFFNTSIDYIFKFTNNFTYKNINKKINLKESGKRLKEFRKELNLSQLELANNLNVARTLITEYELGNFLISINVLYTLCNKYKISADYLLGRIDDKIIFNKEK